MGEYADMIADLAFEDYWESDEGETCKYCHMGGLEWKQFWERGKGQWRLVYEDGTIHACHAQPAHPSEFPDLTKNSRPHRQAGRRPSTDAKRRIRRA